MSDLIIPSRRRLIRAAAGLAAASIAPPALVSAALAQPRLTDDPFSLGVASGEPTPDGMVLWTRLAPRPLDPDGGLPPEALPVGWELAEDEGFKRIVAKGRALARPELGHSVHVEPAGLEPAREYFYRFSFSGALSPVGRTRTAPAPGAPVDRLRYAFGSCQKYESGHYGAYAHLVADAPDLVFFLGDYIYEGDPKTSGVVRSHKNPEPKDLAGYRVRYATYKSDPLLQAAHACAPWLVTWDDHEVANDYGADRDQDFGDPWAFLQRRAAAYQAYYEHMPLRAAQMPVGPAMLLHRTLDWGNLAQFQIVDDRQYRDARPCLGPEAGRGKAIPDCDERRAATRSHLGRVQEAWLLDELSASRARWNVLAQQTLFESARRIDSQGRPFYSADGWENAPANRERIVRRWAEAKVSNPFVIGGDIHTFAAGDVRAAPGEPVVATEYVGGSVTSLGGTAESDRRTAEQNPDLGLFNSVVRGYGLVDLTPGHAQVAFRAVEDATDPKTGVGDLARFVIESGRAGLQRA
ncbi:MAG: alkaline phosphatase D family protein [Phenylobacterium sp.]|uniref:alkaline phosphatase D family protein n=1 Tax=Phenylobacterium sp. TaxID=1871053 RepID=UPI00391C5373